ncbi:MAG: PTS mannitol transporter subunit IICBA [Spirochaetaceae bacterium]|jgi:PTS system mannitol-specific IIC component|nr:PTS mannitol transporter subunit IICBA [Spirochaetaceae bacterium]
MKQAIQKAGRFLSAMVMPNIGAFIAWGFITALFIPTGWTPNEKLGEMVGPMLSYLLPLLIGYTGGRAVGGIRGGVVGSIATMGVIMGADVPMFLGAMLMGPLGGLVIKKIDASLEDKIPAGFEMLINNFSAGIAGAVLAVIAYLGISPLAQGINNALGAGVGWLVDNRLLPLTSILVEPAKVLFLNNAINHGVFTPLGAQQAADVGRSIFYMIESNPGPGLGLLTAYMLVGKGSAKDSAPGAIIIHFLGGIHEIYFPYVLMNPILILAMIGGGAAGVLTLVLFGGGLIGAASPGSIFAEMMMTPKGAHLPNLLGIAVGAGVSFMLSMALLKAFGKDEADLSTARDSIKAMKAESKGVSVGETSLAGGVKQTVAPAVSSGVTKIVFACDAGMGSSAMGATKLRKKLAAAGLGDITVVHSPVSEVPSDAQVIVCHVELKERAAAANPAAALVAIRDFLNAPEYDELIQRLQKK